jgi:hypothetical protein
MLGSDSSRPTDGELAAFADGSLTGRRRERVEELVAASPELQALVAEQRRAVDIVQAAVVSAPPGLRARIETKPAPRATKTPGRRPAIAAAAAALCAVAAVVTVALVSAGSSGPTVADAARLALRPATAAAPRGNIDDRVLPHVSAAGLRYPYWEDAFGWKAAGVRRDRLEGRQATTVFYRHGGQNVGYTILSGPFLSLPAGAPSVTEGGTRVTLLRMGGRTVAVWSRDGRTCILSGPGVPGSVLVHLASWQ